MVEVERRGWTDTQRERERERKRYRERTRESILFDVERRLASWVYILLSLTKVANTCRVG